MGISSTPAGLAAAAAFFANGLFRSRLEKTSFHGFLCILCIGLLLLCCLLCLLFAKHWLLSLFFRRWHIVLHGCHISHLFGFILILEGLLVCLGECFPTLACDLAHC